MVRSSYILKIVTYNLIYEHKNILVFLQFLIYINYAISHFSLLWNSNVINRGNKSIQYTISVTFRKTENLNIIASSSYIQLIIFLSNGKRPFPNAVVNGISTFINRPNPNIPIGSTRNKLTKNLLLGNKRFSIRFKHTLHLQSSKHLCVLLNGHIVILPVSEASYY